METEAMCACVRARASHAQACVGLRQRIFMVATACFYTHMRL